jgi:hypothetical protein
MPTIRDRVSSWSPRLVRVHLNEQVRAAVRANTETGKRLAAEAIALAGGVL